MGICGNIYLKVVMKVLSIREPYASLIMNGKKRIETRSWRTNYRGEFLVHSSLGKMAGKDKYNDIVNDLISDMDMNYGYIICKCKLVDCIYMDEEFIRFIKDNRTEYAVGEYKVGRYAWVLEDVEPIKKIRTKGKLNFWNYEGEYEILDR